MCLKRIPFLFFHSVEIVRRIKIKKKKMEKKRGNVSHAWDVAIVDYMEYMWLITICINERTNERTITVAVLKMRRHLNICMFRINRLSCISRLAIHCLVSASH